MRNEQPVNWIHLDLKGSIPTEARLLEWLTWLANLGFTGILFEYEDRLPWQAWPGTFRPGYDRDAWGRIWAHCRRLALEVVPLIQTLGHMDWLLVHPSYEPLAESPTRNQVCPEHPEALARMKAWIDEVLDLHPGARYLHLGADEVEHLGSCPRCQAAVRRRGNGHLGLYAHYVGALCEHVASRGVHPMIWTDMLWNESRFELAEALPSQTILVHWHYRGGGPFGGAKVRSACKRPVFGASAIRCGCEYYPFQVLGPLEARLENVRGWHHEFQQGGVDGLIHTTWGRQFSLGTLYGPWEGWRPAFLVAANPDRFKADPLVTRCAEMDHAMFHSEAGIAQRLLTKWEEFSADDPGEQTALRWWRLALRHTALVQTAVRLSLGYRSLEAVSRFRGLHWPQLQSYRRNRLDLHGELARWETSVRIFWKDCDLSDVDEFIQSRVSNLVQALEPDWAAALPRHPPELAK